MSAQSAFNSKQNKGLLWNTLNESGCFNGIQNSDYNTIKLHFEQSISNANLSNGPVLELNKQFISYFSNYLQEFKNKRVVPNQGLQQVYSSEARSKASQDQFNYALNNRQNERQLSEPKKPSNINFSDKEEGDKPIKDMDAQLARMMADRKLDFNVNKDDQKKAESWINNGQDRNLSETKKSVSFSDNTVIDKNDPIEARMAMNNTFLSKLKTVETENVPSVPIPSMDSSGLSSVGDIEFSNKQMIINKIEAIESELATIKDLLKK
jgi:hypothetical protein